MPRISLNQSKQSTQDFSYEDFFSPKESEELFGSDIFFEPKPLQDVAIDDVDARIARVKQQLASTQEQEEALTNLAKNEEKAKKTRAKKPKKTVKKIDETIAHQIEGFTGIEVPEEVDPIATAAHVIETQPILEVVDPKDVEIKALSSIGEYGYPKEKISIKKEKLPSAFESITKALNAVSKGAISLNERPTEFRVIVHTNETQLRNSSRKLSPYAVTYKPLQAKLKTNKGTRVILSLPDKNSTSLYIYLSESRDHQIFEIQDYAKYTDWLAKVIWSFFTSGIKVAAWKIKIREVDSPLMKVVDQVLLTGNYLATPHLDKNEKRIDYVYFLKKNTPNSWMRVVVKEEYPNFIVEALTVSSRPGESAIMMVDLNDSGKDRYTLKDLMTYLVVKMDYLFDRKESEWMDDLGYGSKSCLKNPKLVINKLGILKNKITYKPLKNVMDGFMQIIQTEIDEGPKVGLQVKDVVDKNHLKKAFKAPKWKVSNSKGDMDGEAIFAETTKLEFLLTYMYLYLPEYDPRTSSEFITSEKYYYNKDLQKKSPQLAKHYTDVKDRRPAVERQRSLAGRGEDRRYNSGVYSFVLEYTDKATGRSYKYIATHFEDVLKNTLFLTNNPKFNVKSIFDNYIK